MRDQSAVSPKTFPTSHSVTASSAAFFLGLIWALLSMTLAREWVIPNYIPSTAGHILGDPVLYHELALEQLQKLRITG